MQLIIAVVKPFLAEKLLAEIERLPVLSCTICEVKGYGRQKSYLDRYGDTEFAAAYLPKVEIRLLVEDQQTRQVAERLTESARTGRMGDGKIFILSTAPDSEVIEF